MASKRLSGNLVERYRYRRHNLSFVFIDQFRALYVLSIPKVNTCVLEYLFNFLNITHFPFGMNAAANNWWES